MRAITGFRVAGAAPRHHAPRWLAGQVWALAFAAAGSAAGEPFELAPAPYREEDQDTSSWIVRDLPKAARTRADVVSLYQTTYLPGNNVQLAWTGSIATCDPGTTNVDHQQATIDRVNYFRALVNLPAVTLMGQPETSQVQAAALMMSANNSLSHTPPTTWLCYSAAGATGAMSANIALGVRGVAAIDAYMGDAGAGNTATGHRRWILFPPRAAMGTGDIPGGNVPPRPAEALYVFGPQASRPATPNGIPWPPSGFVPYQNLPASSNRWSLSYPGANFANAQVAMSGPGGAIAVTFETVQNGFGDNTLVFLPTGFDYSKPAADTTYNITVSGLTGAGVPASISYAVTVIDPDATPPPAGFDPAQHGLTGSWYEAATSGQGHEIEFFESAAGDSAVVQGAWFTFDAGAVGGVERQRWYTYAGNVQSGQTSFPVTLYQNTGGNFNALPVTNAVAVGTGMLSFSDCTTATFNYTFSDGSGRNGAIPLTRLTPNVTCAAAVAAKATNPDFGFSGNWYDAATSGQGFVVELNPLVPLVFLTWYTYASNGQAAGAAGQRWYTGQASYAPGARVVSMTLYQTTGGLFDQATNPAPQTVAVGTATLTFSSCTAAKIDFNFTSGGNAGKSGTIQLVRVGPTPQGCGP